MQARPRKITTPVIDADLKKILEDYNDPRVFYDTITLEHPSFPQAYHLVNHTDKVIRGGVRYLNFPYKIQLPEVGSPQQSISIVLDNTDQLVQKGIEKAISNPVAIKLTYRLFVEGKDAVVAKPIVMQVENVSVTDQGVQLECSRPDMYKRLFPQGTRYDDKFKGLYV